MSLLPHLLPRDKHAGYLKVVFNWLLTWKKIVRFPLDLNPVYVLESLGLCNANPDFGISSERDGTTQDFVSGTFRVCKFQNCLLAKYFNSANNCSCSHINLSRQLMRNWETDPLLCLKFSTWAALEHLIDLNIAWACFRTCVPGTNMLVILRSFSTDF